MEAAKANMGRRAAALAAGPVHSLIPKPAVKRDMTAHSEGGRRRRQISELMNAGSGPTRIRNRSGQV